MRDQVDDAMQRMLKTAATLSDDEIRQPSLLPGWTRGRVLAHLGGHPDHLCGRERLHALDTEGSQEGISIVEPHALAVEVHAHLDDAADTEVPGIHHHGIGVATVAEALAAVDGKLGAGAATPNHVLSVSPVHLCPATEPDAVPADAAPMPSVGPAAGSGVSIYVVDTGLLADAASHPWLGGVTGEEEKLPAAADGTVAIPPYAGHGTFIAGVARCFSPDAAVHVTKVLSLAGATLETDIVRHLDAALGLGPDIISLSAGGTSRNDLPLLGFEVFWERYRKHKGTVLVAAAGNNSSRRPFWPAALPGVVSVGALAADLRSRAYFSDYGPWVDVYAPGERLINAYARGSYQYHEPPRTGQRIQFWGMALWSGTSFATPVVAGLIAARMSRTGENGRRAADAVLTAARAQALPGVGPVVGTGGLFRGY